MNRVGSLLTGLMLLAAQVPWIACPCAEPGSLSPAVNEHVAHAHHGDCRGHTHSQPAPAQDTEDDGPVVEQRAHIHGIITADLVVDARRTDLPGLELLAVVPGLLERMAAPAKQRPLEGAVGLEPPPPRPPSAACLADNVRLLS